MAPTKYTVAERKLLAKRGHAMSDGSFPIPDGQALEDAIRSVGRARDPHAAKQHIIRQARRLQMKGKIPLHWL